MFKTLIQIFYSPEKTINIGPFNGGSKEFVLDISPSQFKKMIFADFENFKNNFQNGKPFKYGNSGITIEPLKVELILYKLFRTPDKEIITMKWDKRNPTWKNA